ncbi:TRAP transporter large permease [Vibrio fluvialis]|jgi:C4-dicarboxylate transporter DctM subunit|uniref:TRAP transporter large permease protein n=1 Tax=Vibrio fluvialis TaxID=676 RepID=A0AAX2LSP8_VIBFL|nr:MULTISPECIES: TRAP transporter large permease [Vibrio]TNF09919.1 MAG: TRAP transporter large permease [Vibrionaceae bacterium]HDM8032974.1 TRAP transporter large permease [Vibrio fluvialis clinical-1]AMF94857.1 TRAP transporter large permease [Vibrio fluvialis]AVH30807.1 TRAP transporter large permease [Vibrio fluvialis]EKO3371345.1 TRAP transporter large permease [Vibrio fluvialis]
MAILLLFLMVVGFMLAGVPIAVSLGLSSILFLMWHSEASLASVAQTLFNAFEGHYTLLAIPFFILASSFMSTGGVAKRIIRFAIAMVGWFRGGLAVASVVACMMFAALSGSSPATVVAIGSIVIAGMVKNGYTKEFAAGVICNAGTLGILIPPSIVMVVYSAATNVSVGRMFLGGVIPGLLAGLMLIIAIYITARVKNLPKQPFVGWKEAMAAAKDASWGLLLVVIILGGIYGGIFTPTEAAAVAAVYSFLIANFIYRDMGPFADKTNTKPAIVKVFESLIHKDTKATLFDAGKLTIMLLFIIANALILKHVLTEERVPQMITESMLSAGLGPITFLIVVNVLLLIGGQFMEPSGLLIIVAPLVFPIAIALGIDPIHLGIMMVVNMEIGMITPPVGLNLFVTAGVAKMSMMNVVKAALPWVGVMFLFLIIVTYVPWVSTWLPTMLMGPEIITK